MALSSVPIVMLLVAVAIIIIVRQFQARPLRLLLLLGVPLGLIGLGSRALVNERFTSAAVALLAVDMILALGFGIWRGMSFRVWLTVDGQSLRQGTRLTLLLWVVSIALRGITTVAGRQIAGSRNVSFQTLPALLGLTLLAQGIVVLWRVYRLVPAMPAR